MFKSEAKRQIAALLADVKPWDKLTEAQEAELHRLKDIAFPGGIPLPRII
ncbi:hypothetical protein Hosp_076 [Mycobacterium phage Hosp]|nr:hypothetical protein FH38_gp76 [Mycobacterium phage Hosp]AHK12030.1 hypothetical protein Hosp_076 [Mycobacterium phage Hosp]